MPRRVEGPKFRAFFFPLPLPFSLFLSLSGCLLVEFWWCLKRRGSQMCTIGVLGLSCEALAAPKPPGFHTSPNVHISRVPAFKHHQNSTKGRPRERKRTIMGAGEGKKRANFWAVRRRAVLGRAVLGGPLSCPPLLNFCNVYCNCTYNYKCNCDCNHNLCKDVNCDEIARALFLSHCGVSRHVRYAVDNTN